MFLNNDIINVLTFRETKDDMVKKIDEHVQLAIQDSR